MLKPGAVDRAKSCENHFYDCGHRQERRDWSSGSKKVYRKMLHEVYHAPTPGSFEACRRKLTNWADSKQKRNHVKSWFNGFWYKRRVHVFRAFKGASVPNTNMAEAGHSRNATRGAKNKSLAVVAQEHIVECALLKSKLQSYENGTYAGGHCKTQKENETTTFRRQKDRATQFAKELEAGCINPASYSAATLTDASSSHRAPKQNEKTFVWSDSDDDTYSSDSESTQTYVKKGAKSLYRKRKRRSKVFNQSLSMAKKSMALRLTKIHDVAPLKKVFELDDGGRIRLVEICETPTCDCGMVGTKDICKHVIWIMLKCLDVNENDEMLHQKSIPVHSLKRLLKRGVEDRNHSSTYAHCPNPTPQVHSSTYANTTNPQPNRPNEQGMWH